MAATAIVLDLDGTIWDSYPLYARALGKQTGVSVPDTERALRHGQNVIRLLEAAGLSRRRFAGVCAEMATLHVLYPGVLESLKRLSDVRMPLGIVTSLPNDIAGPLLEALELDSIFGEIRFAARKPNATPIYEVLRALSIEPNHDAYYVGDLERDAQTAKNADVSFAWASYGYGEREPAYASVCLKNGHMLSAL